MFPKCRQSFILIVYTAILSIAVGADIDQRNCTLFLRVTEYDDSSDSEDIFCEYMDENSKTHMLLLEDPPVELRDKLERREIKSGKYSLRVQGSTIDNKKLIVHRNASYSIDSGQEDDSRRLAVTTGIKSVLVVWVQALDSQTTLASDNGDWNCLTNKFFGTYGDPVNLKSQISACSFGGLELVPASGKSLAGDEFRNGVYDLEIDRTVNNVKVDFVEDSVRAALEDDLGDLKSQFGHGKFVVN